MMVALAMTLGWAVASASAAAPSPATVEAASRAFADGVEAFEAKDYPAAVGHFSDANRLIPHPNTMINMALALREAGDVSGAWWVLQRATGLFLDDPAQVDAIAAARRDLEDVLFILEVRVQADRRVCVAQVELPGDTPGSFTMALAPGTHVIETGATSLDVLATAGVTRVLGLELAEQIMRPSMRRPVTGMAASTAAFAGLSAGLVVASQSTSRDSDARRPLAIGGAIAGLAAAGTAVALATYVGKRAPRRPRRRGPGASSANDVPCRPFVDPATEGRLSGLPLLGVGALADGG